MNCSSCGANLPPGAAVCPVCGTATPYNVPGSGPAQYDPTMPASPYGAPPRPSTAYGSPPYGAPPPPQAANPYGAGSPPAYPYGAPPMQQGGYGMQAPPPQVQPYIQPPPPSLPPKRRSRVGLVIGIVLLVLLLACAGIAFVVYQAGKSGIARVEATVTAVSGTVTASTNSTPTATNVTPTVGQGTSPSGLPIDSTAAGIITNAKMSNGVDSKYYPTAVTNTFTTQQTPDVVFDLNLSQTGYVVAKWYYNGQFEFKNDILTLNNTSYDHGYFPSPDMYHSPGQGAVELYWCTQSNCSDEQLADVVNFTVTSTSMRWGGLPGIVLIDINRPE